MRRPDNPRFPHTCTITRCAVHSPLVDELAEDEIVIYDGECRAYEKNTTSDKGEVITSNRGLSLPIDRAGWSALGYVPSEGDRVIVNRGVYTESGVVVDKNPSNFGGTHIVWRYDR